MNAAFQRAMFALALTLVLTGCGGGSDPDADGPEQPGARPPNCTENPKACI